MSEDSVEEINKYEITNSNNGFYDKELFIDLPEERLKEATEGIDLLKLSSLENLQTPIATPKQSFNDFLSSDLMKRLEANSPYKSHNSNDLKRKISELNLVNCESEGDFRVLSKQINKINHGDQNKLEFKEKKNLFEEKSVPQNKNLGTRNFKLKTDIISTNHNEGDYFLEYGQEKSLVKEEPKSLFNNSFRNFQQANNFFSPVYKTQQKHVRGDSSPIYSYYDGTAECLSQTFFDEYKKSNNDQFLSMNNFIKKNETNLNENDVSINKNFFNEISHNDMKTDKKQIFFPDEKNHLKKLEVNKNLSSKKSQKSSSSRTSSKKKNNNVSCNKSQGSISNEVDEYTVEMFGRKGWICEMCNNFNYDTRVKCNRCGINKTPKKIKGRQKNEEDEDSDKKKKKPFVERVGDWVCIKCKNLNFSFRVVCNRCQLPKPESDKIFDNYMGKVMNYAKMNEMLQQRVLNLPITPYSPGSIGYMNNNSISINNNYYSAFPQPITAQNQFGYGHYNGMESNYYNSGMGMSNNFGSMNMNSYMRGFQNGISNMQERSYFNDQK